MIPLDYLLLRLVRRHLPGFAMRALLRGGRLVKPGLETLDPAAAASRFCDALASAGRNMRGSRVLVFGYGGYFGVAIELLRAGAEHVVLLDPFAESNTAANLHLARDGGEFLHLERDRAVPDARWITLVHTTAMSYADGDAEPVDLVLSNSVLEHVDDPAAAVAALACLTRPSGHHVHFIDLRDHFFRHPFEMLCYSRRVWEGFLDPPSHLNRWRIPDYERAFTASFHETWWEGVDRDASGFAQTRPRIRSEFLTGDPRTDSITRIQVHANRPRL